MDQKLTVKGVAWASIAGIICGIIMLLAAIGLITSFPVSVGWLGVVLIACSLMVGIFSFRNLKKFRATLKVTERGVQELLSASQSLTTDLRKTGFHQLRKSSGPSSILANWEFSAKEWKNFLAWKKRHRKFNGIANFLVVLTIGSLFIQIKLEAGWFNSLLLAMPIASICTWVVAIISRSSFGDITRRPTNKAIFTGKAVVINKKLNEFATEERSIKEVRIIEEADPKVLEIEYEWLANGKVSSDRIHIPIPKGKLGEAVLLMDKLSYSEVALVRHNFR